MSVGSMSIAADDTDAAPVQRAPRARYVTPLVGLIIPVVAAVLWEFAVRWGWSNGRLVPPPSVIYATFAELAATGELQRHALATIARVAAGFGLGVVARPRLGARAGD